MSPPVRRALTGDNAPSGDEPPTFRPVRCESVADFFQQMVDSGVFGGA